ncbi:MAG TPA: hypothetical protein VD770_02665 [Coxiellaceae bacterium]|nr:hypothetical protein [Coxiellaceae bacterium]
MNEKLNADVHLIKAVEQLKEELQPFIDAQIGAGQSEDQKQPAETEAEEKAAEEKVAELKPNPTATTATATDDSNDVSGSEPPKTPSEA